MGKSTKFTNFALNISIIMDFRQIFILFLCIFAHNCAFADIFPTAIYTDANGESIETTDAIPDAQAPLEVEFKATINDIPDNELPELEWRFTKEGEQTPFVTRYEESTSYTFVESGTFLVSLYATYNGTSDPELAGSISITISTSMLEMPNAFSPNGDGVNDIYKAKSNHRSIVEFHAYIFNRWGQKLFDWTNINEGWDGTVHGKPVKDGTYFVLVKAKGADGREYNIKKDVNILRTYIENEQQ